MICLVTNRKKWHNVFTYRQIKCGFQHYYFWHVSLKNKTNRNISVCKQNFLCHHNFTKQKHIHNTSTIFSTHHQLAKTVLKSSPIATARRNGRGASWRVDAMPSPLRKHKTRPPYKKPDTALLLRSWQTVHERRYSRSTTPLDGSLFKHAFHSGLHFRDLPELTCQTENDAITINP